MLQDAYKDVRYVLSEQEFFEQEANDPFVQRFVRGFDGLIDLYQVCQFGVTLKAV